MHLAPFPFTISDFEVVDPEIHQGITGFAAWRVIRMNDVRIRLVTYSPNYLADHWCSKGHIIYCLEGSMVTSLEDGCKHLLQKGQVYCVGDQSSSHQSYSEQGCTLLIVD